MADKKDVFAFTAKDLVEYIEETEHDFASKCGGGSSKRLTYKGKEFMVYADKMLIKTTTDAEEAVRIYHELT